jgi:hypothetical protein
VQDIGSPAGVLGINERGMLEWAGPFPAEDFLFF